MTKKEAIEALRKAKESYLNRIYGRLVNSALDQEVMNAYDYALNLMKMIDGMRPHLTNNRYGSKITGEE